MTGETKQIIAYHVTRHRYSDFINLLFCSQWSWY